MMISPESYVEQFRGKSYPELIAERESLLASLREQEAAFRAPSSDPYVDCCPSPGVVYVMHLEYFATLCTYMAHHAQAFTGEPGLNPADDDDMCAAE